MSKPLLEGIQEQGCTLIQGDSRNLPELLASEFNADSIVPAVDVTITSPPYADRKTYEADRDAQIGIDEPYEEYLQNLKSVFENVYTVSKDTGTLWVVVNTFKENHRMVNLPGDIIDICNSANTPDYCPHCDENGITVPVQGSADGSRNQCPNCEASFESDGWLLQDIVIWDKKRALPYSSKGSFRNVFEYVLCFSKGESFKFNLDRIRNPEPDDLKEWWVNNPERYHPRGKLPDNIWSMVTPSQGAFADTSVDHPAPFPPKLVERILTLTTDTEDVVLDPFAGSGTVCAQAKTMDRISIGVELSETYLDRYDQLEKEIAEKWESRLENSEALQVQQEEFTKVISGLRQIRYCRELVRALGKHFDRPVGDLGIECIFHNPERIGDPTENPQSFIQMGIELLCDKTQLPQPLEEFKGTVESMKRENPCNSFGINANVTLTPVIESEIGLGGSELYGQTHANESGYLYLQGKHNEYHEMDEIAELVSVAAERDDGIEGSFPPIISPIGVDVPQPKNVCSACGEYRYSVTLGKVSRERKPHAAIQ